MGPCADTDAATPKWQDGRRAARVREQQRLWNRGASVEDRASRCAPKKHRKGDNARQVRLARAVTKKKRKTGGEPTKQYPADHIYRPKRKRNEGKDQDPVDMNTTHNRGDMDKKGQNGKRQDKHHTQKVQSRMSNGQLALAGASDPYGRRMDVTRLHSARGSGQQAGLGVETHPQARPLPPLLASSGHQWHGGGNERRR